nr:hypothetical protein [uncultured bacterium]
MAIFLILTGVVLANNTRFGNQIILQNLAHDIALSIRQAQVYGIAVVRCDPTVTANCPAINQYDAAYGVHFCMPGAAQCTGNAFELFVDVDHDGLYIGGETVLANQIAGGFQISNLCVTSAIGGGETCNVPNLHVMFRRPEPDACINGTFDSDGDCASEYQRAKITVRANDGDEAVVVVESTGQISVQRP